MASSNFIDYVKLYCRSGKGGAGSAHFHRAKYVPKGGPDGGDGGRGGHVIMRGNSQLWTLLHLRYTKHIRAEEGQGGGENQRSGKAGKDMIIEVPLGTVAKNADTGEFKAEITTDGEEVVLLSGGRGGLGNQHFKSSTNQAPRYAQPGEPAIEENIILELKLLADVGLVGFPNAGKSTLLSKLSAAKPEIAEYPFTTLVPNLGIVSYRDHKSFVMADIPGIIEGAHEGRGLGIRFLRHIERNSVLLFMIACDTPEPLKEYKVLQNELKQYNPELMHKTSILAMTKCDLVDQKERAAITRKLGKTKHHFISSHSKEGLTELKDLLWKALNV